MSLLSIHAFLFVGWLLSGGGDGFGNFIAVFWIIAIGGVILFKWIDRKTNYSELSIEDSADGKGKAIHKLNNLHWTPTGSMQTSLRKYVAFRMQAQSTEDFDWLVKYITAFGGGDTNNPYAKKSIMLGGSEYSCNSVNPNYTVTEIYRIPYSKEERNLVENLRFSYVPPKTKNLTEAMYMHMKTNTIEPTFESALESLTKFAENNRNFFGDAPKSSKLNKTGIVEDIHNESDVYTHIIKQNIINSRNQVERRLREDPIVQYNIQLIEEREAELKIKIEEYKEFRSKQDDEILISQSATGMIDFEEYENQLESKRDEIAYLKEEIQELREEIEDIRQDIEDEIEEEEWEREL